MSLRAWRMEGAVLLFAIHLVGRALCHWDHAWTTTYPYQCRRCDRRPDMVRDYRNRTTR